MKNNELSSIPVIDFIETVEVDCFILENKVQYIQY